MSKRKSVLEDLLDVIYEFTEMFWVVGAVFSALLMIAGLISLDWALGIQLDPSTDIPAGLIVKNLGYFCFILPAVLFLISYIFGNKAYYTFLKQR